MQPQPCSFVCTGGTEFHCEPAQSFGQPKANIQQKEKTIGSKKLSTDSQKKKTALFIEKTLIKLPQAVGAPSIKTSTNSSLLAVDHQEDSPVAFYDEDNRKVLIISNNVEDGTQIQHCIQWNEETDMAVIEKAIEDILNKVGKSPRKRENEQITRKQSNTQQIIASK